MNFKKIYILRVIFAFLDPDPDSESGSGSTDRIESGSATLVDTHVWYSMFIHIHLICLHFIIAFFNFART